MPIESWSRPLTATVTLDADDVTLTVRKRAEA